MLINDKRLADMTPDELISAQQEVDTLKRINNDLVGIAQIPHDAAQFAKLLQPFADFAHQYLLSRAVVGIPNVSCDTPLLVTHDQQDAPRMILWRHFFDALIALEGRPV